MTKAPLNEACCSCQHKPESRNLVVELDGTGNQYGEKNTNVIESYNLVGKRTSDNQLCWYNSGIGTYARPSWTSLSYLKKVLYHKIDLAIAWEFERTVMGAYRWLSDNYQDGDCIFLFGFSRGAFQVRVLAAMIEKVGLIHKGNEMQIPFAYELYADPKSGDAMVDQVGSAQKITMAARFKSAFCHEDVKVHFVGAWDTVSSIGIMRGQHMLPGTIDGMKHVCYFRHALALDERRVKFLPEYAYGGSSEYLQLNSSGPCVRLRPDWLSMELQDTFGLLSIMMCDSLLGSLFHIAPQKYFLRSFTNLCTFLGLYYAVQLLSFLFRDYLLLCYNNISPSPPSADNLVPPRTPEASTLSNPRAKITKPQTLEVWFAGTHSDIGGGNVQNVGMDRSRPPLRWMVLEAVALGLRIKSTFPRELSSKEQVEVKESLTGPWKPMEWMLLKRLTFAGKNGRHHETYMPHFGAGRVIQPGQKIHSSLLLSGGLGTTYIPKARFSDSTVDHVAFWKDLNTSEKLSDWLEMDLDLHIVNVIRIFLHEETKRDTMLNILSQIVTWTEGRRSVYEISMNALEKAVLGNLSIETTHFPVLGEIITRLNLHGEICRTVEHHFYDLIVGRNESMMAQLERISTWKDGQRAIYEVAVNTLKSGTLLSMPFSIKYQVELVRAAMVSTKLCLSTEERQALRSEIYSQVENVLSGDMVGNQESMAILRQYSCNEYGKQVIYDATINLLKREQIADIAVTPDYRSKIIQSAMEILQGNSDLHLASAKDVRNHLLDICSRNDLRRIGLEFLTGYITHCIATMRNHSAGVHAVAFNPLGNILVSGSSDVRIWDAQTGAQIENPLHGHTDWVNSIAISPNGKYIIAGSDDSSLILWDMETRTQVGGPWKGHKDSVRSVAFAPDGKRVVSGSHDRTVCLWDVETGTRIGKPLTGHNNWVNSVAFSPDGTLVASSSEDHTVRIWHVATQRQIGEPMKGGESSLFVSFSPNGKQIVSESNKTIRFLDVKTRQEVGEPLRGHTASIQSVSFSPDGKLLASGSYDKTVRIWDVERLKQIGPPLQGHQNAIDSVSFSADGKRVASASLDRTIRVWDIDDYILFSSL